MWLKKLFLLGLFSLVFIGYSQGQKLTCAKEESKKNQQNRKNVSEGNKIETVEYSAIDNKPRGSQVPSVKSKQKKAKKLSEKHENMATIREKLMKTLLENGDVKNVNSRGLTSEEAANKNLMDSKHEEVWALMDEIMKRKNFLRKEIEEFYKQGLSKSKKREEPDESEQIGENSDEDYSEENLSDEEKESGSEEAPDEQAPSGKRYKKNKNRKEIETPELKMSQSERSEKVMKPKFPNTEKYPEEVGTPLEDISDEEANNKRNENELNKKNMQLSKLFVQQMKEIYEMENKSRKAQRAKRHYENQIPISYEFSQECDSLETLGKFQKRNPKKRTAIKKKFYVIDNDPLGFYYYFKQCQKRDPNHEKVHPELGKSKLNKKKSNRKRPQHSKKKRLSKKKRRFEKDGILIKQIEETRVNDRRNSGYFENFLLPQSTQLQAKYLCRNGNQMKWNKKNRPIPNSEFFDYEDFKSSEELKISDVPNVKEYQPPHQQVLTNDNGNCAPKVIGLFLENQNIDVPLEHTTELRNPQKKNETVMGQLHPLNTISNSSTDCLPLFQEATDVGRSLEIAADQTPKIRVPRSYSPSQYSGHNEPNGDCSDCDDNSSNWDELNMYLALFKKLYEDKSCEDLESDTKTKKSTMPPTTTERSITTDKSEEENTEDIEETCTAVTSTPYVVSPGNYGLNLNTIADEINEALESENSDTIVPFEEPPVGSSISSQPSKKTEQPLLLKRPNGFWLPLKLVQNLDGRFNIQLDLKYICRRCTKQREKRRRKCNSRDSNESH